MSDWLLPAAVTAGIVTLVVIKRLSWISTRNARSCLNSGAILVDVRSPAEFRARHIPGALNVPLNDLASVIPREIADKQQLILMHCLSGTRSGVARRQLKSMGYRNVFNLGSYGRAQKIVRTAKQPPAKPPAR